MTAKSFFKKVGRGLQRGAGQLTNAAGKAAGGVLGGAAAKSLLSSLASAAPEAAEAAPLLMLSTGGYVKGPKKKAIPAILHGQEYVLPANAKPTKTQKAIVASNKKKQKKGCKCGGFVHG
jgi:hypothetical protein